MEVIVTPNAKKQLKKLPKFVQLSIISKLKKIKENPTVNAIKLSGYKNSYRIRTGNYRIVYEINNKIIYIALIGHRKEVYFLLKRMPS